MRYSTDAAPEREKKPAGKSYKSTPLSFPPHRYREGSKERREERERGRVAGRERRRTDLGQGHLYFLEQYKKTLEEAFMCDSWNSSQ